MSELQQRSRFRFLYYNDFPMINVMKDAAKMTTTCHQIDKCAVMVGTKQCIPKVHDNTISHDIVQKDLPQMPSGNDGKLPPPVLHFKVLTANMFSLQLLRLLLARLLHFSKFQISDLFDRPIVICQHVLASYTARQ